jgi:nucleoside-diphosphate-sugar epimerase
MTSMHESEQVSILGCGWLGLPLAQDLVQKGYSVKGSSTSDEKALSLRNFNIDGYRIVLKEDEVQGSIQSFLANSEALILNIPPGLRKGHKDHVSQVLQLLPHIKKSSIKKLLFVSSISVFKDGPEPPTIDHSSKPNGTSESALQLSRIETQLQKAVGFKTTILRPGGLFDSQRHPGYILSGRTGLKNPRAPLNLIHKEDVIHSIEQILKLDRWGETFNLVYPYHPAKKEYYMEFCSREGLRPPVYDEDSPSRGKIIDSSKTVQLLNLRLRHRP